MPSTASLLPKLIKDFPDVTFAAAERFAWAPAIRTVTYSQTEPENVELLLHELSHGLLGHHEYSKDVELVAMEAAAWDKALELATTYGVKLNPDAAQDNLDTYREWLHARSTCPQCEATGYQSKKDAYTCVACGHEWRVNEARLCGLRRYPVKTK